MAIHMVTQIAGEEFDVTLSRDDAGNYVAEAARSPRRENGTGAEPPCVRVVDPVKERAMMSLFDSLHRMNAGRTRPSPAERAAAPIE